MKYLSLLLIVFYVSSSSCQNLEEGLQAYYRFNGDFVDQSENQLDGFGVNVRSEIGLEGFENTAYIFDGESSYININEQSRDIEDLVSISAWIKTTNSKRQFVVSKYNSTEGRGYFLGVEDGNAFLGGRYDNNEFVQVYGNSIINDGEWHHIIGVVDGSNWTIWVDCEIENTAESFSNNSKLNCSDPMTIGNWFQGNGLGEFRFFDGIIDEVRIYNTNILTDGIISLCDIQSVQSGTNSTLSLKSNIVSQLYPNPTNDIVNIELEIVEKEDITFKVYDNIGNLILETTEFQFSVDFLSNGIYFVKIYKRGKFNYTTKFVKH